VIACAAPQQTDAWRRDRVGCATASNAAAIVARGRRGQEAATRRQYRRQLVLEQLLDEPCEPATVRTAAMRLGLAREPAARAAYEAATGRRVETVGFLRHDTLAAGCSLDGRVVDDDRLVEIKAPGWATYNACRLGQVVGWMPRTYQLQITHQLWITGAARCDLVVYLPGHPLVIVPVARDPLAIACYAAAVETLLAEVEQEVAPLRGLNPLAFMRTAPAWVTRYVAGRCDAVRRERMGTGAWREAA
jgi:putative phage-type endonuclease